MASLLITKQQGYRLARCYADAERASRLPALGI